MPTSYRGNACTYKRATLLASLGSHTFDYDANGLRTKKNDTVYTYIGGKLIREESSGHTIDYIYGNDGITGIKYDGTVYLFRKNVFGDVTHIYDMNGVLLAHYVYDAWGDHTVVNETEDKIGDINPIRYRSYYYDTETKLYYLRARYYDPETGRFISQDNISYLDPEHFMGLNLYAYCNDNPVIGYDPTGTWNWGSFWKVTAAIGVVLAVTAATVLTAGVATAAIATAVGASTAIVGTVMATAAVGGVVAGGLEIASQIAVNGVDNINLGSVAIETFTGAAHGAIAGALGTTASTVARISLRGAMVALSGINGALHSVNNHNSFGETMSAVGESMFWGLVIQLGFAGNDLRMGYFSSSVLEAYKLDGAFTYGVKQIFTLAGIISLKNIWKNKQAWIDFAKKFFVD